MKPFMRAVRIWDDAVLDPIADVIDGDIGHTPGAQVASLPQATC